VWHGPLSRPHGLPRAGRPCHEQAEPSSFRSDTQKYTSVGPAPSTVVRVHEQLIPKRPASRRDRRGRRSHTRCLMEIRYHAFVDEASSLIRQAAVDRRGDVSSPKRRSSPNAARCRVDEKRHESCSFNSLSHHALPTQPRETFAPKARRSQKGSEETVLAIMAKATASMPMSPTPQAYPAASTGV
jgi:hypothetical protein